MSNFSIFSPSDQKKSLPVGSESTRVQSGSVSYLLPVKSKLGSGQGPSLLSVLRMGVYMSSILLTPLPLVMIIMFSRGRPSVIQ